MQEIKQETIEKTINAVKKRPVLEDITIVLPTLGRPILEVCLSKIISGTHWPKTLIVVHQGDEPNIKDWVKRVHETDIEAVYIHSTERGKPAAINVAFARIQTRFACMTDDDCFVDSNWLQNMHHCLQTNPEWIITGRVEPAGNETVAIVQSKEAVVHYRPRLKFDLFVGGNMGASMEIIRRVGPFDEDPLLRNAAEDVEWGYRALKKGIPIAYAPEVAVSHFGWRVDKEKIDRLKAYAHGHGSFYGKYLRRGDLFVLLRATAHFVRALRRWIHGTITGNTDRALMGQAYCMGLIPGIVAGFRSQIRAGQLP
jgi:GT2 family glycosyltransferase